MLEIPPTSKISHQPDVGGHNEQSRSVFFTADTIETYRIEIDRIRTDRHRTGFSWNPDKNKARTGYGQRCPSSPVNNIHLSPILSHQDSDVTNIPVTAMNVSVSKFWNEIRTEISRPRTGLNKLTTAFTTDLTSAVFYDWYIITVQLQYLRCIRFFIIWQKSIHKHQNNNSIWTRMGKIWRPTFPQSSYTFVTSCFYQDINHSTIFWFSVYHLTSKFYNVFYY